MKEILVLLVLLSAETAKVCSQPYTVDSNGNCRNSTREYMPDESNLCCKKCRPGERLIEDCTETTESVCAKCEPGQYMESWNFAQNCFSCEKCKTRNGVEYAQNCSSTTRARCKCMPGMYCVIGFNSPYCKECARYIPCKVGHGVSLPGTANSNVRCEQCPVGTFSDTISLTDRCRPHTNCHGNAVVRKGNTTSDTLCEHQGVTTAQIPKTLKADDTGFVVMTASTMRSTVLEVSDSMLPVSKEVFNRSTKSPPPLTAPDITLVAVSAGIIGSILLFIIIILVCFYKHFWKKDTAEFPLKVDANGNCESSDKIIPGYLGETQLISLTHSPEQQGLLGKGEACSDHSQCNNYTEALTRTDGCSSHDSIGPLQSTVALDDSCSALSEPMTLISNTEPVTPQPSVPAQHSSQPTSPQIISPVTTSPHVNVNITFHIGNGSGGTPSVIPTNLKEADCQLPFGEEEKSYSIPQQEDGKHSQMSVQDSGSYSV
ncbi:tumor necrosis factor receptor superfamily member 1B-like [Seriola lalandi dorsalis]|uniref:Tumor necrosis factor receptor superfamily, member 1B n=1 Tax=Seriola lalandi dorsalis TaxID=1841481 RepID=A0A3B4WQU2_SERLL|nr:tumor necrosis factor receptor superfamily member 1B-like [Seriola lalandi dorsalis]